MTAHPAMLEALHRYNVGPEWSRKEVVDLVKRLTTATASPGATGEQRLAEALAPFGWTCTEEFWKRYYSDPWVFNLANAVERLSADEHAEDAPSNNIIRRSSCPACGDTGQTPSVDLGGYRTMQPCGWCQ